MRPGRKPAISGITVTSTKHRRRRPQSNLILAKVSPSTETVGCATTAPSRFSVKTRSACLGARCPLLRNQRQPSFAPTSPQAPNGPTGLLRSDSAQRPALVSTRFHLEPASRRRLRRISFVSSFCRFRPTTSQQGDFNAHPRAIQNRISAARGPFCDRIRCPGSGADIACHANRRTQSASRRSRWPVDPRRRA